MRAVVVVLAALAGCCPELPDLADVDGPPDVQCQSGPDTAFEVAIWECVDGRRIVAHREQTAAVGCGQATVERGPCNRATEFEATHRAELEPSCGELPDR